MVRSCTQLKGTMIVPLISDETVQEQNNKTHKGQLTCAEELNELKMLHIFSSEKEI